MARQNGILEITGTMGNLTFYKSQDGMMVKEKSIVSKDKIMNSPAYQRTRENMAEFGNAGKSSKMILDAIRTFMVAAADNRVSSRLSKLMRKVLKEDTTSKRGLRNVALGIKTPAGKDLLNHFNFNKDSLLQSVLRLPYSFDAVTGKVTISNVIPNMHIIAPKGATHVSIACAFVTVEFSTGRRWAEFSPTVELALDATPAIVELEPDEVPTITPDTTSLHFLKFEFYQLVNGDKYGLNDQNFNCLELFEVN
ncbi:MAG: hypothetical protein ACTHJT_05770 [Cytophaga sp.]|uniref:hypothetical protein n=1 Tax=Cytophaga sp. TaxID=29535 RepID=UPI003F7E39D7